jgi:hypothetical protein
MTTVKKLVTLPFDVQEWLKGEAERNLSSANSEIVRAIRQRMERRDSEREAA